MALHGGVQPAFMQVCTHFLCIRLQHLYSFVCACILHPGWRRMEGRMDATCTMCITASVCLFPYMHLLLLFALSFSRSRFQSLVFL